MFITVREVEIKHYLVFLQLLDKWMSHLSFAFTNCIVVSLGLLGWSGNRTVKKDKEEGREDWSPLTQNILTISQTYFQKIILNILGQIKYTYV